jgi:hypothetical protein
MPNLRLLLPYGIHERLSAYAVRDLQPDATIRIGILRGERCNSLIDGDADRVEVSSPFCQAPSLEVGGRVLYARTRTRARTRARGLATRDIFDIPSVHYACVRTRARGLGVVHNSRIGVFADAGIRISVGHIWLLFGFLLNSRSHPATGK